MDKLLFVLVQVCSNNISNYPNAVDGRTYAEVLDFSSNANGYARCDEYGISQALPHESCCVMFANKEVENAYHGKTKLVMHRDVPTTFALITRG